PLTVRDARRFAVTTDLGPAPDPSAPPAPGEPLVVARDLSVALGGSDVLRGVSVEIGRGEVVALLGRNGAGKTTLLRALARLIPPARGRVDGNATTAYVPQDPNSLLFAPTVRRELQE